MARVEGRAYCLMCALLIPTANSEIKEGEEEEAKEIKPKVLGDKMNLTVRLGKLFYPRRAKRALVVEKMHVRRPTTS